MRLSAFVILIVTAMLSAATAQSPPSSNALTATKPAVERKFTSQEILARGDAAAAEQQARDARFDARVRRATSSICRGCSDAGTARRKTRVAAPLDNEEPLFDPAEAPQP